MSCSHQGETKGSPYASPSSSESSRRLGFRPPDFFAPALLDVRRSGDAELSLLIFFGASDSSSSSEASPARARSSSSMSESAMVSKSSFDSFGGYMRDF